MVMCGWSALGLIEIAISARLEIFSAPNHSPANAILKLTANIESSPLVFSFPGDRKLSGKMMTMIIIIICLRRGVSETGYLL